MFEWCDVSSAPGMYANLSFISRCRQIIKQARSKECWEIVNSCKEEMKRGKLWKRKTNSTELKKIIFIS
jgi:hypothetical protein